MDSNKIFSREVRSATEKSLIDTKNNSHNHQLYNKLRGAITSEDVLGKDVIDCDGVFIGVSDKFYIDPKSMAILGISVDKGFLRRGFIISVHYIREVSPHAVFLNMQPSTLHKGKIVFGKSGMRIGKIIAVDLAQDTNQINSITVKTGLWGRRIIIPQKYLESTKTNVFLNITKPELESMIRAAPAEWLE